MATVKDTGDSWTLEIYPEAQPVQQINEPTKGYVAMLGYDPVTDRHLVMEVKYSKNMFAIGDVLKQVDGMKACPKCTALDKARLDSMTIIPSQSTYPVQQRSQINLQTQIRNQPDLQTQVVRKAVPEQSPIRKNVKDMFADALFEAYLTPAGKMMVGNVFGDNALVEESMPRNSDELAQLWEDTTTGKLLRSPGEAKEFMEIIRTQAIPGSPPVPAKQTKFIRNIVIG